MSGEIQAKISRRKISEESLEQRLKKAEALNAKGNKTDAFGQVYYVYIPTFPCRYIISFSLPSSSRAHQKAILGQRPFGKEAKRFREASVQIADPVKKLRGSQKDAGNGAGST